MGLGIRPINDFAFRKVFASPENQLALVSLLNSILEPRIPIVGVSLENPFNYQEFETDKLSILDIKATDRSGTIFDIEIQLAIKPGLLQRLVFYGAELYADQMRAGDDYRKLKPVMIIALVEGLIWHEIAQRNHRFVLTDQESGRVLADTLSIHIVEMAKYNLTAKVLSAAKPLERWVFWLLHAQDYDAEQLQELLPGEDFRIVNSVLLGISQQTKDKNMYDAREKYRRDQQWILNVTTEEAEARGEACGKLKGKINILEEILGLPVSDDAALSAKSPKELQSIIAALQTQVTNRN